MLNVILIAVFNYSHCLNNLEYYKSLYGKTFKKIIFYSDYPLTIHDDVNFVDIKDGVYTQRIFKHFYTMYKDILDEYDGIFYTMDDNILNLNIINLINTHKIVSYQKELKYLKTYSGWQWDNGGWGKKAIENLMNDAEFEKYNIDKFCGTFADWFYLPKRYLTSYLFDLFELFGNHKVFLELAIPSIINNIEKDASKYQTFTDEVLWNNDRNKLLDENYVRDSFNKKHNLVVHPIKFNANPTAKIWLNDIFLKTKCVIITTINKPTETILKHIKNKEYDTIIVGDVKTPEDYHNLQCIYLDIATQKRLFPQLSDLIPYNHYSRKNLGYLYAIMKGYELIYETDDDNIPKENFDNVLQFKINKVISEKNSKWINIMKYFTNNSHIWPRGFPLSMVKNETNYNFSICDKTPGIINGLVENDPDVDACFRLICKHQNDIVWDTNKSVMIDNNNMCVFNSQNTFWLKSELFISMLIPCTVSFRYCDILRGIISNIILKKTNNNMMYISPNVIQKRNEHDLIEDLKSEFEMYEHNEKILEYIEKDLENVENTKEILYIIYKNLLDNKVIKEQDLEILKLWLEYF